MLWLSDFDMDFTYSANSLPIELCSIKLTQKAEWLGLWHFLSLLLVNINTVFTIYWYHPHNLVH